SVLKICLVKVSNNWGALQFETAFFLAISLYNLYKLSMEKLCKKNSQKFDILAKFTYIHI
ncbi:MAG: hypothetical protein MJ188_12145, partial [Treponema sp.]|nr:hypothetical protein [Treponema sp.]